MQEERGEGMTGIITVLALFVAYLFVCVTYLQVKVARLELYTTFLKERVVDVDARMCIVEGSDE